MLNNDDTSEAIALTNITLFLKKTLTTLQKVDDNTTIKETLTSFKKVFAGVDTGKLLFKLTENRISPDPDAKYWQKCLNLMGENCKVITKIEEEESVIEITDASTRGFISSHLTNNQQPNIGTLTNQTSQSSNQRSVLDTNGAVDMPTDYNDGSPSLFQEKKNKRKTRASSRSRNTINSESPSAQTPSSSSDESPDENSSNKRTPPKRRAKSTAIEAIAELAQSDTESVDVAVPKSKALRTEKRSSPSSSKQTNSTLSTSTNKQQEDVAQLNETPTTSSSSNKKSSEYIEKARKTDSLTRSWTVTLEYLKKETPIPNVEKIKDDLKNASIASSQPIGFNYAKLVKKTIPKNVLKLWKDYPLTFFLLTYKIMQDIKGIVKIITTILEEDEELGTFYRQTPYAGCPAVERLYTIVPPP
ncbi:predicted protein [Naegleria gruberi]|uniref:Predicted protein n=1 Tax=Naegleria gruberi TaxID=5762 RepID=D2VZH0_NAEGR|nr:uncharacterized protein NAEGRDRAFT_74485 [Naegleria gruberi]EFC37846.1 predicted protein [Naegleria gruberi]|eukprot:XP_002670590.1 predicted protein [Naegleria gruberi strain NEG-M]